MKYNLANSWRSKLTKKRKQAVKGLKTINQLASEHELHPNQISQWKRQLLEEGATIFGNGSVQQQREAAKTEAELYEQIGRLKMEVEWLKKSTQFN
ncbi:MAG: hypothetical protein DPW09_38125 [Anaerolineae bacterium]|nr:hypothetical protein [Anaerolineae bacterium]